MASSVRRGNVRRDQVTFVDSRNTKKRLITNCYKGLMSLTGHETVGSLHSSWSYLSRVWESFYVCIGIVRNSGRLWWTMLQLLELLWESYLEKFPQQREYPRVLLQTWAPVLQHPCIWIKVDCCGSPFAVGPWPIACPWGEGELLCWPLPR